MTPRERLLGGLFGTLVGEQAQQAIEEVYWRHRIWPIGNPRPKPELAELMPDTSIRETVEESLRKSSALEKWWGRPITAELYDRLLADELAQIRAEYGNSRYDGGHFQDAVELFMRMSKSEQFDEFLSLPAYVLLP